MKALLVALALLLGDAVMAAQAPAPTPSADSPSATPARPLVFRDKAEEQRFRALVAELRCVMCQNQSLADSNAMIAQDLRAEILELMRAGRSDLQIKQFLVERYTDFVLYRPELRPMNWLLWFGPGLLLLVGAVVIVRIVHKQAKLESPVGNTGNDEQEW